jgi:hypothetical protein
MSSAELNEDTELTRHFAHPTRLDYSTGVGEGSEENDKALQRILVCSRLRLVHYDGNHYAHSGYLRRSTYSTSC